MIVDGRKIVTGTTLPYDLCIIGAGAAGITLALELADTRLRVALVESGGFDLEPETQALAVGFSSAGRPYFELSKTRLRMFGGTTNHWTGWCRPLSPDDFIERGWIPHSGWPIKYEDVVPYYRRAQEICELGPFRYEASYWVPKGQSSPGVGSHTGLVNTTVFQYSAPTRFGRRYRKALENASNVDVVLYSNAVGFTTPSERGRVRETIVATLAGNRFSIRARAHVLATGGIENARLLLATRVIPRAGNGRARDLIGRFFMEHPHVEGGLWMPSRQWRESTYFQRHRVGDHDIRRVLTVPEHVRRRFGMLGFSAELRGPMRLEDPDLRYTRARESLRRLRNLVAGERGDFGAEDLGALLTHPVDAIRTLWQRATHGGARGFLVFCRCEQRPNEQSRVFLDRDSDVFGIPRPRLSWKLSSNDLASIRRGIELIGREVGALGAGHIREAPMEFLRERIIGGNHHLGTTRMAMTPSRGVVDPDCRAFGTKNLYVAGSSVFPTGGYANPTLTIVALSSRLADHLSKRLE